MTDILLKPPSTNLNTHYKLWL